MSSLRRQLAISFVAIMFTVDNVHSTLVLKDVYKHLMQMAEVFQQTHTQHFIMITISILLLTHGKWCMKWHVSLVNEMSGKYQNRHLCTQTLYHVG